MKRNLVIIFLLAIMTLYTGTSWSKEATTSITLRNDCIKPEHGQSMDIQSFFSYWHYQKYGLGLESDYENRSHFFRTKSYATIDFGKNFSGLVGFNTDSAGKDYILTGLWYINSWKKLRLVSDVRNYWSAGKQDDYLDIFVLASYPISSNWFIGASVQYDRFWQSQENWFLAGPVLGCKVSNNWTIVGRLSHEWDWMKGFESEADRFRLELKTTF